MCGCTISVCASQLLSAGVDGRTVAGWLGHRNAATTLNVYATSSSNQTAPPPTSSAGSSRTSPIDGPTRSTTMTNSQTTRRCRSLLKRQQHVGVAERKTLREKSQASDSGRLDHSEVATIQREHRAVAESFGQGDDRSVCAAEA